jgi:DNA repair protein RadC
MSSKDIGFFSININLYPIMVVKNENKLFNVAEIQVSYNTTNTPKEKIFTAKSAYKVFLSTWNLDTIELQEEFKILLLNRANEVLGIYPLSKGGITGTVVDQRLIFAVALKCNATAILIAHNHPSGKLQPSEADISITKSIYKCGEILNITLIDHLIITKEGYFSFSDEGKLM